MTAQNYLNDDNMEVNYEVEVKYKYETVSLCNLLLIIFGSLCILIGIIDMAVFYAVPNNEIKNNKRKYPDFEFAKPEMFIVVTHFLEHIFLILTGIMIILAIIPGCHETLGYILPIIFITLLLATFYFLNVISSFLYLHMIKKEDFTLTQITSLLNLQHPISDILLYTEGEIARVKGGYSDCKSDGAADVPIESDLIGPHFNPSDNEPDLFYLIVTQKVNISDELFEYIEKGKEKVVSCENKFSAAVGYFPAVEGQNLISKGQKIPFKFTKKSAIASLVFGLGVYYELYQKSIPMMRYTQNSYGRVLPNVNYNETISQIDCAQIGKCRTKNDIPTKKT